jgi:hypothetical protein
MSQEQLALRRLAEEWRTKAGAVRVKYRDRALADPVENVARSFERCAEDLDEYLKTQESSPKIT